MSHSPDSLTGDGPPRPPPTLAEANAEQRSGCCPWPPDWSRMFVRGIGWVHVSRRPTRGGSHAATAARAATRRAMRAVTRAMGMGRTFPGRMAPESQHVSGCPSSPETARATDPKVVAPEGHHDACVCDGRGRRANVCLLRPIRRAERMLRTATHVTHLQYAHSRNTSDLSVQHPPRATVCEGLWPATPQSAVNAPDGERRAAGASYLQLAHPHDAFDSTRGYPGEGPPGPPALLQLRMIGPNVRSIANPKLREAVLASLRASFDVVALTETWAVRTEEDAWAKDWGDGPTFWSSMSGPERAGKGVALLFANNIAMSEVKRFDSAGTAHEGRMLLVTMTLYHRHKMAFLVTYAPAMQPAAANAAFFRWVSAEVKRQVPDLHERCVVWFGDHNNVPNPSLDESPRDPARRSPHPRGGESGGADGRGFRRSRRLSTPAPGRKGVYEGATRRPSRAHGHQPPLRSTVRIRVGL